MLNQSHLNTSEIGSILFFNGSCWLQSNQTIKHKLCICADQQKCNICCKYFNMQFFFLLPLSTTLVHTSSLPHARENEARASRAQAQPSYTSNVIWSQRLCGRDQAVKPRSSTCSHICLLNRTHSKQTLDFTLVCVTSNNSM